MKGSVPFKPTSERVGKEFDEKLETDPERSLEGDPFSTTGDLVTRGWVPTADGIRML